MGFEGGDVLGQVVEPVFGHGGQEGAFAGDALDLINIESSIQQNIRCGLELLDMKL